MNEARDVLWVQPTTVGGCNDLGVADAKEFAKELGESAIHVAVNFDEGSMVGSVQRDGFFGLRISLSLKDPDDAILAH